MSRHAQTCLACLDMSRHVFVPTLKNLRGRGYSTSFYSLDMHEVASPADLTMVCWQLTLTYPCFYWLVIMEMEFYACMMYRVCFYLLICRQKSRCDGRSEEDVFAHTASIRGSHRSSRTSLVRQAPWGDSQGRSVPSLNLLLRREPAWNRLQCFGVVRLGSRGSVRGRQSRCLPVFHFILLLRLRRQREGKLLLFSYLILFIK